MNEQIKQVDEKRGEKMTQVEKLQQKPLDVLMNEASLVLEGSDKELIQDYNDALKAHVRGDRHTSEHESDVQLGMEIRDLRAGLATRFAELNGLSVDNTKPATPSDKPTEPVMRDHKDDLYRNWPMSQPLQF